MYNEKVMQAFSNPKNVGEIENPDGFGKDFSAENVQCRKQLVIFFREKCDSRKEKTLVFASFSPELPVLTVFSPETYRKKYVFFLI